jgi:inhibitor of the pro-sigma K processing machinery
MAETVSVSVAVLIIALAGVFLARLIVKPIKLLWKILLNTAVGLALLLGCNYAANMLALPVSLPVSLFTILIVGFLGVPGIFLLICFQILIH